MVFSANAKSINIEVNTNFSELTEPVTQLRPIFTTNSNDVGSRGKLYRIHRICSWALYIGAWQDILTSW